MIEVKVIYERVNYHKDKHIKYLEVVVKGHATLTTGNDHLKVCSSVTSVTAGSEILIDNYENTLKIEKGLFHFVYKNSKYDAQTQNTIDVVVCQLYYIYQRFPKYFKSFEMIEKETANVKNEKSRSR